MSGSNEVLTIGAQVCALVLATALITCQKVWEITDKYREVKDLALLVNSSNMTTSTLVDYCVDETVLQISCSHFLPWLKREGKEMRMQLNTRDKCASASNLHYYSISSKGCSVSFKLFILYSSFIPGSSTVNKIHCLKEKILLHNKESCQGMTLLQLSCRVTLWSHCSLKCQTGVIQARRRTNNLLRNSFFGQWRWKQDLLAR